MTLEEAIFCELRKKPELLRGTLLSVNTFLKCNHINNSFKHHLHHPPTDILMILLLFIHSIKNIFFSILEARKSIFFSTLIPLNSMFFSVRIDAPTSLYLLMVGVPPANSSGTKHFTNCCKQQVLFCSTNPHHAKFASQMARSEV